MFFSPENKKNHQTFINHKDLVSRHSWKICYSYLYSYFFYKNNCMYQFSKRYTKILIALLSFFNFLTFCKECIICMLAVNIAYFVCKCRHLNNIPILLAMRNNHSIIIIIHWNTWSRKMFDTRHMRVYNLLHVELRSYSTFQDLFLFYFFYCFGFLFFYSLYLSLYTEVYRPRICANSYTTMCSALITLHVGNVGFKIRMQ